MAQTLYLGNTAFSNVTVGSTTVTAVYVGSTKIWEAGSSWTDPDLANASYDSVSFSVASEETVPTNIGFSDDGTNMYIIGVISDKIHQYTLSTAWDLSTASYASKSLTTDDSSPRDFTFKPDGTKVYFCGTTNDTTYQYSLSTAWDISTATTDNKSFSSSTQDGSPVGIKFKNDGSKVYIVGATNDTIYQYSLSTAWDISTASYDSVSFDLSTQQTSPQGIEFNPDGTTFFVPSIESGNRRIYKYTLSTAWDISTASYASVNFDTSSEDAPWGLAFKSDGSKMYIVGTGSDTVYQYST